MALTAKQRTRLYQRFSDLIGDEEAEALLSQFPTNDLETPATKDFVRAECIALKSDLVAEIGTLRTEMHQGDEALRTEMHDEIGALRTEVHQGFGALDRKLESYRAELHRELRLHLVATLTFVGALLTAFRLL